MVDLVLDFGNALIKWFEPRSNAEGMVRHAIAPLSESEWRNIVGRSKTPPDGYIKVNGQHYAVGDVARRHIIRERPRGAARYRPDYYGVGLAYAMSQTFGKANREVSLYASHAPRDISYVRQLTDAAKGEWLVETVNGVSTFRVREVGTFDEPLGGYSHYVLTERGEEKRRNPLSTKTTLVLDCGGYTVDTAAIDPNGQIDLGSIQSTVTGVIDMLNDFEAEMRRNNALLFQDAGDLDIRRVETAMKTGQYTFGKIKVDCKAEAEAAFNALVNDIVQVVNAAGGLPNFDFILLTGGGAALLYDRLQTHMPRAEFLLAESETMKMQYANVYGGAKLAALLKALKRAGR